MNHHPSKELRFQKHVLVPKTRVLSNIRITLDDDNDKRGESKIPERE